MKNKKLIILCKGNSVTGGSELVHQLCHELSSINRKAYVYYYPFAEKYLKWEANKSLFDMCTDSLRWQKNCNMK